MARVATAREWTRAFPPFDPFRTIYRLLTSVRVALMLLTAVVVGALLGVVFPQAPDEVRAVPSAYAAYTEFQRGRYGVFTDAMRRLGLFEVFHSYWFNGLLLVLLFAVALCTMNRIPPIVRNVRRPVRRVNDRYFERAHHRAEFSTPADPVELVRQLRRRRYRVAEVQRDGATYLFADRFGWAQFGTFVSHLSLILFMSGAVVTKIVGFAAFINIPEQGTQPVFPTIHAGQMQVENRSAAEDVDKAGNVTRYHSDLAVFRNGQQLCAGTSTVNDPLHCAGYTFHQTTFSPDGVELQVRDLTTGQVTYREVADLGALARTPSPHLVVRDASGATLFDDTVVLIPFDQAGKYFTGLAIPRKDSGPFLRISVVVLPDAGGHWRVLIRQTPAGAAAPPTPDASLQPGDSVVAGGYTFAVPDLPGIPGGVVQGVPGMEQAALLQLATTSAGQKHLDVLNMGALSDPTASSVRFDLVPGQPQTAGNFEYTFLGPRSVTGITVRNDPGSTFIWVATALMMLGLAVTFYLPRRRLWAKITPDRTYFAGVADRIVNFSAEMRRIGAAAGSPDALVGEEEA